MLGIFGGFLIEGEFWGIWGDFLCALEDLSKSKDGHADATHKTVSSVYELAPFFLLKSYGKSVGVPIIGKRIAETEWNLRKDIFNSPLDL